MDHSQCEKACFVSWVTELVRSERPRLVSAARAEGLGDAEALDAVQDGLITFLGLPGATDGGARLLVTVVRNAARNARRRHHRARPHDGDADEIPADDDTNDTLGRIERAEAQLATSACVAELGETARRVVILRLLDELSGDEVAAELGTTAGNVAVMLHRAKEKLRACLSRTEAVE